MIDRPLVSIVIACFNHGRFLSEAIDSALGQTYRPIEVVVVDDGSTDRSAEIARQYPVKLVQQANRGLAAAGNAGVKASHGEFIMRLDADDRLTPTYVEETLQPLLNHAELHFVYTQVQYFGARSGTYPVEEFDPETLAERNYVHASAMMRRSAFDAVGGYSVDMRGLRCEDWDLWLSFTEQGMHGKLIAKPLLEYRQHSGPSMVTINLHTLEGMRRELTIARRLRDHHPQVFATASLFRRLVRLPGRLWRREVTLRFALLLVGLYLVMVVHGATGKVNRVVQSRTSLTAR